VRTRKQRQVASLRIAGSLVAALALLLAMAFAVPAGAETTGSPEALPVPPVDAPAPVGDVQAGAEEAVPAPTPTSEPVEAPAAADSTATESSSSPAPPSQTSTSAVPARQLPNTDTAAALPSADRAVTTTADRAAATTLRSEDRAATMDGLDAAVAPIAARASDPVGEVQRAAAGTTTAIAEPLVRAAKRDVSLEIAQTTLRNASPDQALAAVAAPVREALGGVDPSAVESLLPRFARDLSSPLAAAAPAGMNGLAPADRTRGLVGFPGERQALIPVGPDGGGPPSVSLGPDPVAFGGVQPLTSAAPNAFAGLAGAAAFSATSVPDKVLVDSVNSRLPGNPPADLPSPPSRSPGAAPGSGGSTFVPLAALLALLALAASATSRRLGEVPVFRPPTPFVCALERPG